ncbi:MAG: PD40 domain-containing protein [Marinilabiliaceae bacterium]|nr:PD40 domain-containing protein [Marinilabiliaceae bacterium]
MKILFITPFLLFMCLFITTGQTTKSMANEAYQLFKNGDYEEALVLYEKFYTEYPRDIKYNFYYGACLAETNTNLSLATQCLKYASLKKFNNDVYFFLARTYQLMYEFDIAIENFQKYIKITEESGSFNDLAKKYIAQCETGKTICSKIYHLKVLKADTCSPADILDYYSPANDIGKIMKNNDFFESGIDPEGIMFSTERGDMAFYSIKNQQTTNWDLYKIEKLIDGWSEGVSLGSDVNSIYNELYPMLHTDGVTLYFSSDRPGGLGGFDIYKATYNTQKKTFSNITNMGIPFNSPKDDYFFVCDDFSEKAWFVSNRNTSNNKVVIYQIIWNNSVIKSFTEDNNQLKKEAILGLDNKTLVTESINSNDKISKSSYNKNNNALFHFQVADSLEYTQFEHFKSELALSQFKQGLQLVNQRDSLAKKMSEKRRLYAVTNDEAIRNQLVVDILALEKQTYNIDGSIDNYYYQSQKQEQTKINELVRLGQYQSNSEVRMITRDQFSIKDITFPKNLTLYTNDEFGRKLMELQEMYSTLFNKNEVYKLKYADSLYAWGNMLNIESSRLLEKATHTTPDIQVKMPIPFKSNTNTNTQNEEMPESLVKQARNLKLDALKLYHLSLDTKYSIYRAKYHDIRELLKAGDVFEQTMSFAGEAMTYYKAGNELINQNVIGVDLETFEKAGTFKRNAVSSQEKGLSYYNNNKTNNNSVLTKNQSDTKGTVQQSYSEIHKGKKTNQTATKSESKSAGEIKNIVTQSLSKTEVTTPEYTQKTESESLKSNPKLIYKIQIGVFRNQPDQTLLSKINDVSFVKLTESGLMKYYSGHFNTYNEAVTEIVNVRNAGFEGAFVTAFFEQNPITISKARELENNN